MALRTYVTEIERRIVCGEMAAGARLDEEELAGQLEVDTPVVREALCRLERDGFVRPEVGGAYAVAPLSEIEDREGYPVVILLEGLAVRSTPVPRDDRAAARDQRGHGRRALRRDGRGHP
jgi:DNA-binding GntR family transcriptional regulator